ncbi:protein MAIN-LIKE 1-like [Vicia villosa]|uniref:protein MAIN-LIKE 1-like n=1 Tax=Vicia villosa TaxID=3911 RepID=UPI00273B0108|nr:protein MAIN-LIKE 1-like [Vicia villosa]
MDDRKDRLSMTELHKLHRFGGKISKPPRRQASPIEAQEVLEAPQEEAEASQGFEGGPSNLSLLSLYSDHTARHVWDGEDRDALKFINHGRKITSLQVPNELWFMDVLRLSELRDLSRNGYPTVNHGMLSAFVERWQSKTLSFHLPRGEMSITLDDVSFLLHLLIRGRFLDHNRINRDEALVILVDYLGADLEEVMKELKATRGAHARF